MTDFSTLGLSAPLLKSLERLSFSIATPIQAAAIPLALAGRDVLGTAQTGTGKTAAFGLPLIEHVAADRSHQALVITPTRELAGQVQKALESFIDRDQKIRTALLIGGEPYFRQNQALARGPQIIIGTPGRINDHLQQETLDLSQVSYLVLDETDRMLDMGFSVQIDAILESMQRARQTMLFSATLPPKIERMAKTYMSAPERVSMGAESTPVEAIAQSSEFLDQGAKLPTLIEILNAEAGSAVIFVRTKYGTERMAKNLSAAGIRAEALHGDLRQRKRDNVIRAFRAQKFQALVATDVAARGLDVPHVTLVVNHDLPQVAEDYIHRIGRTARAGAAGRAINFVSPQEKNLWAAITRMLNPKTKGSRDEYDERTPRKAGGKGGKSFGKSSGKPFGKSGGKSGGRGAPRSGGLDRFGDTPRRTKGDRWDPAGESRPPRRRDDWKDGGKKPFDKSDKKGGDKRTGKPGGQASKKPDWKKDKPNKGDWNDRPDKRARKEDFGDGAPFKTKKSKGAKPGNKADPNAKPGKPKMRHRDAEARKDKGKPKWKGKSNAKPRG